MRSLFKSTGGAKQNLAPIGILVLVTKLPDTNYKQGKLKASKLLEFNSLQFLNTLH